MTNRYDFVLPDYSVQDLRVFHDVGLIGDEEYNKWIRRHGLVIVEDETESGCEGEESSHSTVDAV